MTLLLILTTSMSSPYFFMILIRDLPPKMILSNIITSFPPSYNNIVVVWSNVLEAQQTMDCLEDHLLQHEHLLQNQGSMDDVNNQAFFVHSTPSVHSLTKKSNINDIWNISGI